MGTFVVVVGGGPLRPPRAGSRRLADGPSCGERPAAVIAVDSGLDIALTAGLTPTVLVGDLDSISTSGLEWARRHGVRIEAHPADKDATDTALALATTATLAASEASPRLHVLCGSATDRLDHLLGLLAALGAPDLATFRSVRIDVATTQLHVLHPGHEVVLALPRGHVFSLLSLHGTCAGVHVEAARWPLADATLVAHSTLGISNESTGVDVTVRCASGVLTVVVPEIAP